MVLTADLSGLPVGNNAQFTAGAGGTSGTLSWTPTYADSGSYGVTFITTSFGLADTSTTELVVAPVDQAPVVVAPASVKLTVSPAVQPLKVAVNEPPGSTVDGVSVSEGPPGG